MNKVGIIHAALLFISLNVHGGDFLKQLVKPDTNQKLFVGVVEEKQKLVEDLKKEQSELVFSDKIFLEKINQQIDETKTLSSAIDSELKKNPDDEFLIKQQSLLRESEQILKDTQRAQEDAALFLKELIDQLMQFLADTEFEVFKKKNKLQERLYYSFENLQELHDHIIDYERRITQLNDQEKSTRVEKDGRKRSLAIMQEEYEKRQQDLQSFIEMAGAESPFGTDIERDKELFKLEDRIYKYKKQLAEVRLREIGYKVLLVEFQHFIAKAHLDLFKKQLRIIKSAIHVSEADVALAEEDLAKEQKAYFTQKDLLRQQRENVVSQQKIKEKELQVLSKHYNISLGADIDEWSKKPRQTVDSYMSIVRIGALNADLLLLGKEKDLLDANIAFEEEKFNYKKIRTEEKKTYHKISTRGFLTEEEIAKERTEYEIKKKDAEEKLKLYQAKINAVGNSLNQLKKTLDRITALHDDTEKQKDIIFKGKSKEYTTFTEELSRAESAIKKQVDVLGKLTGLYSGIVSELNSTVRLIDFISTELQASTIWYRPAYAITLEGVKNIVSDSQAFFNDVRIYLTQFNVKVFLIHLKESFMRPLETLLLIVKILLLMLFFSLLKRYETYILHLLFVRSRAYGSLIGIASFIVGAILAFIRNFHRTIFIWILLFLVCGMIPDHYIYILFYLVSIPLLLYLSNRFIKLLISLNNQYDHVLLSEDFQRRFDLVFSTLLYVSITIFFFRLAFMLSSVYVRSELPTILLAGNFIILQISLILLITKEQIMGIIPEHTDFWRWIYIHVNQYYYLILFFVITVIVMSNPYVGFGRLVFYLLSGLMYMLLLMKALSFLHDFVKRLTSFLFFSQEETIVRERFSYAKTCFGLVIIASFVLLGFIGFIVSAKIWGWDVTLSDFRQWLTVPLLLEGTTHPISTLSLLKIIAYVLGGLAVAYSLKQYVLARIFDLLLVESGVQHTVTSIIQYVVIIIALFIGFNSVGLGALIGYIFTALALSIGLYIKDPISDFVSYFIILVQRPIKIGDYVQIDSETMGVVRKITPRSVILRRKNSTTIVVPNSHVMSKSIENWNYVRNFIAINDISLLVYFKENPQQVKEILQVAVEAHPNVLKNPRSIIRLSNFSEIGYEFMVRCFISSAYTLEMWDIGSDIRLLIAKALRDQGIELAIPMYKVDDFKNYLEERLAHNKHNELNKNGEQGQAPPKNMKE
jgi:small-conductance mechanosensitive channel